MKRKEYSWVPKAIVLFFVSIGIADAYFIYLAEITNRAAMAMPRQQSSKIYFQQKMGAQRGTLIFMFKDKEGLPIMADEVKAYLKHLPSNQVEDVILKPTSGMRGKYMAAIETRHAGQWQVVIETMNPHAKYEDSINVRAIN